MVKVLFSDHGTKQRLRETLRSIREQAERTRDQHDALARDLVETGGPFPDRLHLNALVLKYLWDQAETIIRWATWAEQQVEGWPQDISRPSGGAAKGVLRRITAARG